MNPQTFIMGMGLGAALIALLWFGHQVLYQESLVIVAKRCDRIELRDGAIVNIIPKARYSELLDHEQRAKNGRVQVEYVRFIEGENVRLKRQIAVYNMRDELASRIKVNA
jgi:hypothetical protein